MISLSQENCTGCGTCVKVCPHAVLSMRDKKAWLIYEEGCIECGACELNCHDDAIVVPKGVGCLLAIVRDDILGLGDGQATTCGC